MLELATYLITDSAQARRHGRSLIDTVAEAVAGGVTTVQVREKNMAAADFLLLVETIAARLPPQVGLLINDRIDVFLAARARGIAVTGVHVGQRDLPAELVRELVGPTAVIGLTASTAEEVTAATDSPAKIDYLGIGVVHSTGSKVDAPPTIGVAGVAELARHTTIPAVAIGGITPDDLLALRSAGLAGAATVSWVCNSPTPRTSAQQLARAWQAAA